MALKIYRAIETLNVFQDTDPGSPYGYAKLSLASLGTNTARSSALFDRGTGSKPIRYKWRGYIQWATTGVLYDEAHIYLAESDGTVHDGGITPDSNPGVNYLTNLRWLGMINCQMTSTGFPSVASGTCIISSRYFMIVVWNRSDTKSFTTTSNISKVLITAVPNILIGE